MQFISELCPYNHRASVLELSVPGDNSCVQCAAISTSGRRLCASTDSKTLAVWQLQESGDGETSSTWQLIGSKYIELCAIDVN